MVFLDPFVGLAAACAEEWKQTNCYAIISYPPKPTNIHGAMFN